MARFLHRMYGCENCNPAHSFLSFCWTGGLLSGIWLWYSSGGSLSSLMRSSLYGSVSIVRLVFILLLPFLLSAFAVLFSSRWLIYPIAFGKGVFFAFVSMGVFSCFGCAGWLIRLFLCFSEIVSLPLLYWLWIRLLRDEDGAGSRDAFLLLAPVFLIGSIDYCFITPFFSELVNFIER